MEKVFREEFEKPITHFIEYSNLITKIFLIALLFQFIKKNNKYIDINSLYDQMVNTMNIMKKPKISFQNFQLLVDKCAQMKIIEVTSSLTERTKVIFNRETEDISYGLKND